MVLLNWYIYLFIFRKAAPKNLSLGCAFVQFYNGMFFSLRRRNLGVFWVAWTPHVLLFKAETVEPILSSQTEIVKARNYKFLEPWLGTGLVTSTGTKWRARRKLLTPAFHFRILEDFIPTFNEQSKILVKRLSQCPYVDDIVPCITTCTLDIVCETAMGTTVNAQSNPQSDYVKSVAFLAESFMMRNLNPLMWWTPLFKLWPHGKQCFKSLKVLHDFSRKVIQEKKRAFLLKRASLEQEKLHNSEGELGIKRKRAFLDLLLEYNQEGLKNLDEEDIREEVDTFMFGGHDTTSMAICWSLYLIGQDPIVQAKVHEEIDLVFGDDRDRPITVEDLSNLKYLECCMKETLRLFPSVPIVARRLQNETIIDGHVIPKRVTVCVMTSILHRDPKYFPQPEIYDPDRFLPENSNGRHPYAYVPFSAGPRNCIGQKFALMEEKIILVNIFRELQVTSLDRRENIFYVHEMVTRPKVPMRFIFRKRFK